MSNRKAIARILAFDYLVEALEAEAERAGRLADDTGAEAANLKAAGVVDDTTEDLRRYIALVADNSYRRGAQDATANIAGRLNAHLPIPAVRRRLKADPELTLEAAEASVAFGAPLPRADDDPELELSAADLLAEHGVPGSTPTDAYLEALGAELEEEPKANPDVVEALAGVDRIVAERAAADARRLFGHYFRLAFEAGGLKWDTDNAVEVEGLVDLIVTAARA